MPSSRLGCMLCSLQISAACRDDHSNPGVLITGSSFVGATASWGNSPTGIIDAWTFIIITKLQTDDIGHLSCNDMLSHPNYHQHVQTIQATAFAGSWFPGCSPKNEKGVTPLHKHKKQRQT